MKHPLIGVLFLSALFSWNGSKACAAEPITLEPITSQADSSFLQGLINKVVETVTTVAEDDIYGTWNYRGSACTFESDDLLKKAGGEVAARQVEKKMDETFAKVGIKEGMCSYTFNEDKTFSAVMGKKTLNGTFEYDAKEKTLTMTFFKLAKMNVTVKRTGRNMDLLFDADKLLKVLQLASSVSSLKSVAALGKVAEQFDGLLLGYQLEKN
ncbi:MAG: DUF4923 family protein [Bacteroidaceae bacterium]